MGKFMILHLEDDPALKETVMELLMMLEPDSEVHQFTNSDDALRFIESGGSQINVFLLDVRVPGQTDGIGVAKRIRALNIDSPIIFMSAYQRPAGTDLNDTLNFEWIKKPWSVEQLIGILERAHASTEA
ncbi:MAG: response regulator [Anaerolineae bacterium]|nr:response regulator [Anaerolineae bacterium]